MSDATKDFCEACAPFRTVRIGNEFVVRDCAGYSVATTDDEDAAAAIADVLNDVFSRATLDS